MAIPSSIKDRELAKFADADGNVAVRTINSSQFEMPAECDAITRVVMGNVEIWQYRNGGELGTIIKVVTVTYAEPALKNIISVVVT